MNIGEIHKKKLDEKQDRKDIFTEREGEIVAELEDQLKKANHKIETLMQQKVKHHRNHYDKK